MSEEGTEALGATEPTAEELAKLEPAPEAEVAPAPEETPAADEGSEKGSD